MKRFGMDAAALLTVTILSLSTGCLSPKAKPEATANKDAAAKPAAEAQATADAGTEGVDVNAEAAARIEALLQRTEQYAFESNAPRPGWSEGAPASPAQTSATTAPANARSAPIDAAASPPAAQPAIRSGLPAVVANGQVDLSDAPPVSEQVKAIPVLQGVGVRTGDGHVAPANTASPTGVNAPMSTRTAGPQATANDLIAALQDAEPGADDLDRQWQLRLMQLAFGQEDEALAQAAQSLTPAQQKVLSAYVRAGAAARRAACDPATGCAEDALDSVEALRRVLSEMADPVVSSVALCRKVLTFGVFEEMDEADFVAGRTVQTIVYSELKNLRTEQTADGGFRTLLGMRLELFNPTGTSVWQQETAEIEDVCRRPRSDFFVAQRVTLPPTLPPGEYILKVMVEDKLSGRAHETTHPLTLQSPTAVAARTP